MIRVCFAQESSGGIFRNSKETFEAQNFVVFVVFPLIFCESLFSWLCTQSMKDTENVTGT